MAQISANAVNITLQFVAGRGLGSKLIKWFGGGPQYSHVDIVWPGDGRLLGARNDKIGDVPAGMEFRPADYVIGEKVLRIQIPVNPGQAKRFYESAMKKLHCPYDKIGILGFIAGRDWREAGSWFCSEAVTDDMEAGNIFPFPIAAPANRITPADLILMCSVLTKVTLK